MLLSPDTGTRTRGDVLLTGPTGFLGMELMARLLEDGDRRVWALVRASDHAGAEERVRATLATLLPEPDAFADRVVAVAGEHRLLEFAVRANWGRRPMGRAEAGGGSPLSEPALA